MKIISHILMTCIMLALSYSVSAQKVNIGDVTYEIINNKVEIISCQSKSSTISIPSEVKINNKNYKVMRISYNAFNELTTLQEITLPETIDSIGIEAFKNCTSLKKVVLPKNLRILKEMAFENCTSLASVTFSDKLEMIDSNVFIGCNKITTIVANQTDPIAISDITFTDYVHKNARLIVPNGCADKYRNTKGWDLFANIEEQTSGINSISTAANSNASASFNLAGQKVNAGYKGIVVKNGKKVINK